MGCKETDPNELLFTNHVIVAWFNFVKMFLDKENYFWEQVLWYNERKIELYGYNDVQKI